MNGTILVTYASRAGSTAGVAEAIGKALAEGGAQVEVRPVQEVGDLAPYAAVVAGSAIQGQSWLPEAVQFVQAHRAELAQKRVAIFSVCMTMAMRNAANYRAGVLEWVQPVRALLQPVSEGVFAGALDIGKIPSFGDRLKFRLSVLTGVWKEGDHRDWAAIRAWAQETGPRLAA
jgi:menaquinone-dependent protoporphyrinogen oxidase